MTNFSPLLSPLLFFAIIAIALAATHFTFALILSHYLNRRPPRTLKVSKIAILTSMFLDILLTLRVGWTIFMGRW